MNQIGHLLRVLVSKIYALPLWETVIIIAALPIAWAALCAFLPWRRRTGKVLWSIAALTFLGIITETLLLRSSGDGIVNFELFSRISGSLKHQEGWRTFIMNVLLFLPFGLSFGAACAFGREGWKSVVLTILAGILLSLCVEALQFIFRRGNSELDDLVANGIGTTIGTMHIPLARYFHTLRSAQKKQRTNT